MTPSTHGFLFLGGLAKIVDRAEDPVASARCIRQFAERIYGAEAHLYRACTGVDMDISEMERPVAERIVNLERCIDVRNTGRRREDDEAVIPHFQWPEKTEGTHLSADANEFRSLLDDYYALRGWDKETGRPSREKLEALGLQEVAEALHGEARSARTGCSRYSAPKCTDSSKLPVTRSLRLIW